MFASFQTFINNKTRYYWSAYACRRPWASVTLHGAT